MLVLTRVPPGDASRAVGVLLAGFMLAGCGINTIPKSRPRRPGAKS